MTIISMTERMALSTKELTRLKVLSALAAKQITSKQASRQLGLYIRQVQLLKQAYIRDGDIAIAYKSRTQ